MNAPGQSRVGKFLVTQGSYAEKNSRSAGNSERGSQALNVFNGPVHKREISSGSNGQHVGVLYVCGVLTEYGDTPLLDYR